MSRRYKVILSGWAADELRALRAKAKEAGKGEQFDTALRDLNQRLQVYPQFGERLRDAHLVPLQQWIGAVPPLVVHYVLDDARSEVNICVPIKTLPNTGY